MGISDERSCTDMQKLPWSTDKWYLLFLFIYWLIDWLEKERETETEMQKERNWFVFPFIYAFIVWFWYVPWLRIEPATLVYGDDAPTSWAAQPRHIVTFTCPIFSDINFNISMIFIVSLCFLIRYLRIFSEDEVPKVLLTTFLKDNLHKFALSCSLSLEQNIIFSQLLVEVS